VNCFHQERSSGWKVAIAVLFSPRARCSASSCRTTTWWTCSSLVGTVRGARLPGNKTKGLPLPLLSVGSLYRLSPVPARSARRWHEVPGEYD
jgi:hypothetical protein